MKRPFHLVFVCIGNRNRSPFAEFYFSKLISQKDNQLVDAIRITSAGFVPQRMKDKMAALKIGAPDPFFGRPLARTTRDALASRGISAPEGWETRELTSDMVKEADLIITVLPDQKKDLVRLFPKAAGRIFTIREISEWDDYLLQEDYDFKEIPRDSTLWDYVEENPDYVSNILFEMEKMLIKAYPSIMAKLRLRVGE